MTVVHVALILAGYALKAVVTVVLWRRYGPRVRALGRLARARKASGRPLLARATPGHMSRTFRLGPLRRQAAERATEARRPPGGAASERRTATKTPN